MAMKARFIPIYALFLLFALMVLPSSQGALCADCVEGGGGGSGCPPPGTWDTLAQCDAQCSGVCEHDVCDLWSGTIHFYWCDTTSCTNECTNGQRVCEGGGYKVCGNFDTDYCTEWSWVFNCPSTMVCDNGWCVPDNTAVCGDGVCDYPPETYYNCPEDCDCVGCGCEDDCAYTGQRECVGGGGYHICGYYDADECKDWSPTYTCPTGTTCQNGQCVIDGPECGNGICEWPPETYWNCPEDCDCTGPSCCEDECAYSGQRQCSSASSYEVCGNYDTDTCLEWGTPINCPSGQTCDNGQCVSDCTNECVSGQRQCNGNGYQYCGNFDPDVCTEWGPITPCPTGTTCQNGQCVSSCTNECVAGQRQCSGNGYQFCGNFDPDACTEWGPVTPCPTGTVCQNGQCVSDCTNECINGQRQCVNDGGYQYCGNFDTDICTEWGPFIACPTNTHCDNGICVGDSCTDECILGQRECIDDGTYRYCGNFDQDSCTEWGPANLCPPDTFCQAGFCESGPDPESPVWTPIPNQFIRCDQTFTSFDLDNFIYDPDTPTSDITFIVSGGVNVVPSLNETTHVVTFTIVGDGDFHEVLTFIARDPEGNTATIRVTFIRQGCNIIEGPGERPRILSIPSQTVICGDDFQEFDLDNFAYDPDGDDLEFFVYGGVYIQPELGSDNVVEFDYDDDSDYDIEERLTFRATDEDGNFAEYTAMFSVIDCEDEVIIIDEPPGPKVCQAKKYVQNSNFAVYLDDVDCDNIPDVDDNCMYIPNFDQADFNNNGIGDKCDLVITKYKLNPDHIDGGRTVVADVELTNLMIHDVENVKLTIDIPKLKIKQTEYIDFIGQERQESVQIVIPTDTCIDPGQYEATLKVKYLGRDTSEKDAVLVVMSDKYCSPGPVMLNSDIHVFELQDIKVGDQGTYPIEITNNNPVAKQYILAPEGLWFADYAFVPSSVNIVQPGETKRIDLIVMPQAQAPLGEQNFMLNIATADEDARQLMVANLEENPVKDNSNVLRLMFTVLIVLIVIALLLWAAIVLHKQIRKEKKKRPGHRPLMKDEVEEIRELDEFLDDYSLEHLSEEERKLAKEHGKVASRKDMFDEFDK